MLPLEPIDERIKPTFRDATTCLKWLDQLQLTNLSLAQGTLRTRLDEFNRFPMRGNERLKTLEVLREPINTVQTDFAKRLLGKKLPLSNDDFIALISLASLWQSMLNGYLRCVQSLADGDSSLSGEEVMLCQRCMVYGSLQLGEFLRAGYEPDAKSWQRFHTVYAHIEEQGLQKKAIADKSYLSGRVSCRTIYTKILLLHRARLLGLRRKQWPTLNRWLDSWGDNFTVETTGSMTKEDAPPLAVDLAGSHGLIPVDQASDSPSMRFLAMVPLSKLIRVKTILLQQGQSPTQLDLGDDMTSKECSDLLNRLHTCWCERRAESLADNPREAPVAELCYTIENIYTHIARKPFRPPDVISISDMETQKQIETFGRVLDQTDRHNLVQLGFLTEQWLIEEDGLLHARLLRKTTSGERLGLNQIVCVHKADAESYKLGVITMASINRGGQLYIGVRYLPGTPQAVVAHGDASGNLLSGSAPALALPEIAKLHIPASIIIPRDWFQTGRHLDLTLQKRLKLGITLEISVEKGNDFERVGFTPDK